MLPDNFSADRHAVFPALPEFDPDPALWERIQTANGRRVRRRRVRLAGVFGMALAGVVAIAWVGFSASRLTPPERTVVGEWPSHSQRLQDQWVDQENPNLDPHIQARLRLLDSDLQAAYDRGASDPELVPLWSLRSRLLQSLVQDDRGRTRRLTRI